MSNNSLERLFQIMAVILVGVAAFFFWQGNYDGIFVSAALGCVCFFLSFRFQVKERLDERETERIKKERELEGENYKGDLFGKDEGEIELDELELDNKKEKTLVEKK